MTEKRIVTFCIIESPYAPFTKNDGMLARVELARNEAYLNACLADSFARGEIPFASHAIYTRNNYGVKVLDDTIPEERKKGMQAGFDVATALSYFADINKALSKGDYLVPPPYDKVNFIRGFYVDRGWTSGMADGMLEAGKLNQNFEKRVLNQTGPVGHWSRENDGEWSVSEGGSLYQWRLAAASMTQE